MLPLLTQALGVGLTGSLLLGYSLSVLNTASPALAADFKWCADNSLVVACLNATLAHGMLSSALIVGAVIGCLMAGSLLSFLGRRKSLIVVYIGFLVTAIAASVAEDSFSFRLVRIATGVFVGTATVIPAVYVSELVPGRMVKLAQTLPAVGCNAGILLGILIGFPLAQPDGRTMEVSLSEAVWNARWWRHMVGLPGVLSFACLCLLFTTLRFEPPHHLRATGRPALQVEYLLWGKEESGTSASASDCSDTDARMTHKEGIDEAIAIEPQDVRQRPMSIGSLEIKKYIPALALTWTVAIGQQLSGMNAILASSNNIFMRAGLPPQWLSAISAVMAGILLITSMLSQRLNAFSTRVLLSGGAGLMGMALLLLPVGSWFSEAVAGISAVLAVLAFAILYGITYGPCLLPYMFDVLPAKVRDTGLSVGFALNWLASVAAVQMTTNLPIEAAFSLFALVCFGIAMLVGMPLVKSTPFRRKPQNMELASSVTSAPTAGRKSADAAVEKTPFTPPDVKLSVF